MNELKEFINYLLKSRREFEVTHAGVQSYVYYKKHVFIFDIAADELCKIEHCKDFSKYKKPEE
jgi:hypothetical protein